LPSHLLCEDRPRWDAQPHQPSNTGECKSEDKRRPEAQADRRGHIGAIPAGRRDVSLHQKGLYRHPEAVTTEKVKPARGKVRLRYQVSLLKSLEKDHTAKNALSGELVAAATHGFQLISEFPASRGLEATPAARGRRVRQSALVRENPAAI
jgi:hypothetical protein